MFIYKVGGSKKDQKRAHVIYERSLMKVFLMKKMNLEDGINVLQGETVCKFKNYSRLKSFFYDLNLQLNQLNIIKFSA